MCKTVMDLPIVFNTYKLTMLISIRSREVVALTYIFEM